MNGKVILKERISRNWEQFETAGKLNVSQSYLSLLEAGKRPVTGKIARRAVSLFNLPPTALPLENTKVLEDSKFDNHLSLHLAGLGYPKFSHLRKSKKVNPAVILMTALRIQNIQSRTLEALPWLIYQFSEMDWSKVINAAKLADAQNRLGFLLSLAHQKAKKQKDADKQNLFNNLLSDLEQSKLHQEDSFQRNNLTETEKKWLRKNRPENAKFWRVLSNLSIEHLVF